MFSRLGSLRRSLLRPTGPRMRPAAPLRAYGKLEVAAEYVDVGCDDHAAAQQFRHWIREGMKRLESAGERGGLRLRHHFLLRTSDAGRLWTVACLWHSGDKRSEQGIQRCFPFSLFVIVPAPERHWRLATAVGYCAPLWQRMVELFPALSAATDRAACIARVRQEMVFLAETPDESLQRLINDADGLRLGEWLSQAAGVPDAVSPVFLGLQRQLLDHWQSKGQRPDVWRLPISSSLPPATQAATWLEWLDQNLKRHPADLTLTIVAEADGPPGDVGVLFRPPRVEDFAALSGNPAEVDRALGPRITSFPLPSELNGGPLREQTERLAAGIATLPGLAKCVFPRPKRRWFG